MKVIFTPQVTEYLDGLVEILVLREYFGFMESAVRYVEDLADSIKTTLPMCVHKPAPKHFDRYGKSMKYATFRKSKHTCWYAFFKTYNKNGETVFLVRHIANNHIAAHYL